MPSGGKCGFPGNGHLCEFVVLQRFPAVDWMRERDFVGVKGDRFRGIIDFPDHPFVTFR